MTLFEHIKDQVTTRDAAERYGLQVSRHGMCKCPFHDDKNPSMKVDRRFHCFGCQADGDVISFVSRLFDLSAKEAALQLVKDFGIHIDGKAYDAKAHRHRTITSAEVFAHQKAYCFDELINYRNLLTQWQQQYQPKSPDEELHPRFLEALNNLTRIEYELDVLLYGTQDEIESVVADFLQDINEHKEEPNMEPVVKTPVYHQSAAFARENGELDQFRNSHWTNIACKNDIEDAIARHFDGMHLDKEAVTEVLERYGAERMSMVLAATVQVKAWDGRFSNSNKDWAFSFEFADTHTARGFDRRDEYAVASHPAVLDGFIKLARQEIKALEHPATKEESKQAALPDMKLPKRKPQTMER